MFIEVAMALQIFVVLGIVLTKKGEETYKYTAQRSEKQTKHILQSNIVASKRCPSTNMVRTATNSTVWIAKLVFFTAITECASSQSPNLVLNKPIKSSIQPFKLLSHISIEKNQRASVWLCCMNVINFEDKNDTTYKA